jgi:hypothetical protein
MDLLERLAPAGEGDHTAVEVRGDPRDNDRLVLQLMRHAARLSRFERETLEFPLHVRRKRERRTGVFTDPDFFDGSRVENFLERGPSRTVLVGHPGAGKSYALRKGASRIADQLHQKCLSELFSPDEIVVPVFVDLKLYRGELRSLVEATLPAGLSLAEISSKFRMRVFLDAFNEIPGERLEQGSLGIRFF